MRPKEVIIWFTKGNDYDGELRHVTGIIVDESQYLYTVAEVKREVIIGKRSIIKIEEIQRTNKRNFEVLDI